MAGSRRVILTRAAGEAADWVAQLRFRGFQAEALPLLEIAPPVDATSVHAAWRELGRFDALMFVSINAVEQFFGHRPPGALAPWELGRVVPRAWAPGPGTRAALLAAGVPVIALDAPPPTAAQFDSEALWQQVGHQVRPGMRLLLVRGADAAGQGAGREWLTSRLGACGAQVDSVAVYVRRRPAWSEVQRALARAAAADGSAWVFSSSEAVANLASLLPAQVWSEALAVATHPRIARALQDAGFGVVTLSRPAVGDIVAALESFG